MTRREAIKKSLEHWRRMVEWVEKQPVKERPDYERMKNEIKENWFSHSCELCKKYCSVCRKCPLDMIGEKCYGDWTYPWSFWRQVRFSKTYGEWLTHARMMITCLDFLYHMEPYWEE